ncbi:hypothetical protein HanPI659440_Chr04g0176411 [Helianthus annuus]|nr:hypothetical protein HanPI659440_Chr04g0176411 [Helianthus annuus]
MRETHKDVPCHHSADRWSPTKDKSHQVLASDLIDWGTCRHNTGSATEERGIPSTLVITKDYSASI